MLPSFLLAIAIAAVLSEEIIDKTVLSNDDVDKPQISVGENDNNTVIEENDDDDDGLISENENENTKTKRGVNDIADDLVQLLKIEERNARISELREKLNRINSYVIDQDQFAEYLKDQAALTDLNTTSFYKSLQEEEYMKFLFKKDQKEPKNLYLQLKEKLNRDDILRIIANKGNQKRIVKYARRMMGEDAVYDSKKKRDIINAVVDKILGETANDNHKFDFKKDESIFWDPQPELEDLQEYHKHQVDGRRLFKGERTTIRYYPFMVSIHVVGRFWCGGVLYWHDIVVTSASCLQLMHNNRFFRENPRVLQVRVGSNHSRIGGEVMEALEVYFHPSYNPRTLRNNIALIRLRRRLFFSYHRVPKLLELSKYPHGIAATAEVMLLGWGVTKMSQKLSYEPIYLQRKFLPVYPNSFCKEVYGPKFITQTMFCAGTMTTGEGACDHDAGGPAVLGGKLVGVISYGPTVCGFPNAPTVFTLVGAYADWIEKVNQSMPDYYRGKKHTTTTTRHIVFSYLETMLYVHTSSTQAPETTTTKAPDLLREGDLDTLRGALDPKEVSEEKPQQRIPPPIFKLTKNKSKKRMLKNLKKKRSGARNVEFLNKKKHK